MSKCANLDTLRANFNDVAQTIGDQLAMVSPRVVALVAKWPKEDLVPGLSDMDFRIVCDEATTAEDWLQIDRHVGRIHKQMVEEHPEWNRINEHTAGAGISLKEFQQGRFHHPEYPVWNVWWGHRDWLDDLQLQTCKQPLTPLDEQYHLQRFLAYYSPYIHGIDPPINLAEFEPKYALHSRCWHYFAPPITSAATLLAKRHFSGKHEALRWLADHGFAKPQVRAVLEQVSSHYDTKEQTNPAHLQRFEQLLFTAFEELLPAVCQAIEFIQLPQHLSPQQLRQQLALYKCDPLMELLENVRYARIRAGRYYFYANAPAHFSVDVQLTQEQSWTKKLVNSTFKLLQILQNDDQLTLKQCFENLGLFMNQQEWSAVQFLTSLAALPVTDGRLRASYLRAAELFPYYYQLLERAFGQINQQSPVTQGNLI